MQHKTTVNDNMENIFVMFFALTFPLFIIIKQIEKKINV